MSHVLLGSKIERYYDLIDSQNLDAVLDLFDESAVYERADATYPGKRRIELFFREERRIRGEHVLQRIYSLGKMVIAAGRFEGHGEAGDVRSVGFADFWTFNDDGLVVHRRTYLATGHEIVHR